MPEGIFNDDYHIFGVNWSKNKLEFYVDDKIVGSFDYGDNEEYKRCFNRPQYIQLNLATGGNWAGDAGNDLAGQKYEVDYVYYGQNAQQKADSEEYYENAIKIFSQGSVETLFIGYGTGSAYLINKTGLHNVYLQILFDHGLIGLALYGSFFIINIRNAIKKRYFFSMCLQIVFLVYCITGNPLYDYYFFIPYLLFVCDEG